MQSISVKTSQSVKKNVQIGLTGETGNALGQAAADNHLHFEIRTVASPGRGLSGRVSPITVFKVGL
jgi:murein DD-endopeptidase MepM/ murein hydrolase activator NlpD